MEKASLQYVMNLKLVSKTIHSDWVCVSKLYFLNEGFALKPIKCPQHIYFK